GKGLTPDLRAMLPDGLRETLTDLKLGIDGPFAVEDATLELDRGADPARDRTRFDGALTFAGLSLEAGVAISDMAGRVDASYTGVSGRPPQFRLVTNADSFRVSGVS